MKPNVILPIVTAVAGFGIGWLVKPAAEAPAAPAPTLSKVREKAADPAPTAIEPAGDSMADRPSGPAKRESAPDLVQSDQNLAATDDAKLARLVEALSLNDEQKAQVLSAVAAAGITLAPEGGVDGSKLMELATLAGAELEKAILSKLTPEQVVAFEALRTRSLENSVETVSQEQASRFAKITDLSPEQRQMILERVRADVRTEYDQRPAGLDLLLDTSPLPTGSAYLTSSSLAAMPFMAGGEDANEKMEAFREEQRKNLDGQVDKYRDILTPAQLTRFQLDVEAKKRLLNLVEERTRNVPGLEGQ